MPKSTRTNAAAAIAGRSEEHTSEFQSRGHLVCRLLLEKKKTGRHSNQLNYRSASSLGSRAWWVLTGSNRRHSPCKGDALPAELSTLPRPPVHAASA